MTVRPFGAGVSRRLLVVHAAAFWLVLVAGVAERNSAARAEDDVGHGTGLSRAEVTRQVSALTEIGADMFRDRSLSASGAQSCASCHDPAHAFAPANDAAVQLGGKMLDQPGFRAVPSLMYKQATPHFTEHFHESEDESDESVDAGPTGGLTWDGRVDRLRDQALIPLLSPVEMANPDRETLAAGVDATYGPRLRAAISNPLADRDAILRAALTALEAFQQTKEFAPYTSKYDAYLSGRAPLNPAEARGLALFNEDGKGGCARCHPSAMAADGSRPQFTDFSFAALGVPRNHKIPANADPNYFDLGLCGPYRTSFIGQHEYCGMFKTPTLRNVATRKAFFHNGRYRTLREVLDFYVFRDTEPARVFPTNEKGVIAAFDDLPFEDRCSLDVDPPFDRTAGMTPALSSAEIDDVIAFLGTLTDGYASGGDDGMAGHALVPAPQQVRVDVPRPVIAARERFVCGGESLSR
jgi:cytochrome c peroxidase